MFLTGHEIILLHNAQGGSPATVEMISTMSKSTRKYFHTFFE